jgi:hypothetical protein
VGADTGSYLVSVKVEVTVLEEAAVPAVKVVPLPFPEVDINLSRREAA